MPPSPSGGTRPGLSSPCPISGSIGLALMGATDAAAAYATCFARFTVQVDSACVLTVVPSPAAAKWHYAALWSAVAMQHQNWQVRRCAQQPCRGSRRRATPTHGRHRQQPHPTYRPLLQGCPTYQLPGGVLATARDQTAAGVAAAIANALGTSLFGNMGDSTHSFSTVAGAELQGDSLTLHTLAPANTLTFSVVTVGSRCFVSP